jgi:hypothetical protein
MLASCGGAAVAVADAVTGIATPATLAVVTAS